MSVNRTTTPLDATLELALHRRVARAIATGSAHGQQLAASLLSDSDELAPEVFCFFLGYGRSGSTLASSVIDAHPDAVVANELHVMRLIDSNNCPDAQTLFRQIVLLSRSQGAQGRPSGAYEYPIANGWQGLYRRLRAIGDKKACRTTLRLAKRPQLLEKLQATVGDIRLAIIHVVRNPFDNCATLLKRHPEIKTVADIVRLYALLNETVEHVRTRWPPENWITVHHEAVIAEPRPQIGRLTEFLGLDRDDEHEAAAANLIYKTPRVSRHEAAWGDPDIRAVNRLIERFDYLNRYSYSD